METIRDVGHYGRLYWCIKTGLSRDGEIHVMADRLEVTGNGALIAWGRERAPEAGMPQDPMVNLVCAPGHWSAAYASSPVDGGGVAIQNWAGEVPDGGDRAAQAEQGGHLREVPSQTG